MELYKIERFHIAMSRTIGQDYLITGSQPTVQVVPLTIGALGTHLPLLLTTGAAQVVQLRAVHLHVSVGVTLSSSTYWRPRGKPSWRSQGV